MDIIQRDLGRVEGKLHFIQEDLKTVKTDIEAIKKFVLSQEAVKTSDWKRLSFVGLLFTIVNQLVSWVRPFA